MPCIQHFLDFFKLPGVVYFHVLEFAIKKDTKKCECINPVKFFFRAKDQVGASCRAKPHCLGLTDVYLKTGQFVETF